MRCKIVRPRRFISMIRGRKLSVAYHEHEVPHCSFDMESFGTLNSDHGSLRSESWKLNEGSVVLHNFSNLVRSCEKHAVNLSCRYMSIFHEESCHSHKLMNSGLRHNYVLSSFSCNKDLFWISSMSTFWAILVYLRKGRWKVDCRVRSGFNHLDILSVSSTDNSMKRELETCQINYASKLNQNVSLKFGDQRVITHTSWSM